MTALDLVRHEPRTSGRPEADDASAYGLAGAVAGWMFVAAAVLAAFLAATPGLSLPASSTRAEKVVVFAVSGVAAALGVSILAFGRRMPRRVLYAVPLVTSVLICIPLAVARTSAPTGQILLVWPVLFAGYLLPERVARLSLAVAAGSFTVVAVRAGTERALASWIAVVTSLCLVYFLTVSMRRHINTLLDALGEQALTDALTGLANRRSFIGHLDRQIAAHRRNGRPFAVWFIDVDHFKRINDTHGHPAGDRALTKLAGFLSGRVRRSDVVARIGGEEFAVVLPDTTLSQAAERAQLFRSDIEENAREWPDPLTISIGVAAAPDVAADVDSLLSAADQALYAAKESGRNTVRTAGPL